MNQYVRLCRLLDDSLRPFSAAIQTKLLPQQLQKELFIALSQVLTHVKQWTQELDSDEEVLEESEDKSEHSVAVIFSLDGRSCSVKIICDLISLLAVKNRYAQHLVVKILVAVSEFMVASERDWADFMQFLCVCLEVVICNALSSTVPDSLKTRYSYYDSSVSRSFLNQNLKCANWSEVTEILRVLCGIQKYIKREVDDEAIMKLYLDAVSSLILNVPWDLLGEVHVCCTAEDISGPSADGSLISTASQPRDIKLFSGQFTKFLCSFVGLGSSLESEEDFYPVTCKIIDVVPVLIAWSHSELQGPHHVRIFHYLRHKLLMLMIKLSSSVHIKDDIALSWLHILHKYFEDLLSRPLPDAEIAQYSLLEDLPFCTSCKDAGEQNMSVHHLQRLAVFLFLRCSLHLVSVNKSCHESANRYYASDEKLDSEECCNRSEGMIELHKWLQGHVPPETSMSHKLYFQLCVRFTSSLLQLFMHEDDILFDMLLQLLYAKYPPKRQDNERDAPCEENTDLLASDLFNPVNVFHIFLAQILYDHQVLLDYLISKDTGSSCAEYLMRSLRIICNSWNLFVEFPGVEEASEQSSSKRQKLSADDSDFNDTTCSEYHARDRNLHRDSSQPFMAARNCLVSLRASIDSLNQKNLFPYNPRALLQRLIGFEELCAKEQTFETPAYKIKFREQTSGPYNGGSTSDK